jgi:hypothetical protein
MRRVIRYLAGAGSVAVLTSMSAAPSVEPAHVTVVGNDYAFLQLPATLPAGPAFFAFENRGTKRHELSMALLNPRIAVDSLLRNPRIGTTASRAVSDSIIGLLVVRPGERSGGQLYVTLLPGRTYLVICTLRDTPDAQPHAELGMIGTFHVPESAPHE